MSNKGLAKGDPAFNFKGSKDFYSQFNDAPSAPSPANSAAATQPKASPSTSSIAHNKPLPKVPQQQQQVLSPPTPPPRTPPTNVPTMSPPPPPTSPSQSTPTSGSGNPEQNARDKKRLDIVNEILSTETSYLNSLKFLSENYYAPLNQSAASGKPIISVNEIKSIFSILDVLVTFHTELHKELEARLSRWAQNQVIGDVFLTHAEFFRMYPTYVNSYNDSMPLMVKLQKDNKAFSQFIESGRTKHPERLDIHSLLIMPVQRLPRYRLLLEALLPLTPATHTDHDNLTKALEKIKTVADFLNEAIKRAANTQKLISLQDQLEYPRDVQPINLTEAHRLEVFSSVITPHPNKAYTNGGDPNRVYLYNDLLLLGKASKSSVKYIDSFALLVLEVRDVPDVSAIKYSVELISAERKYHFSFAQQQEKDTFIRDFYVTRAKSASMTNSGGFVVEKIATASSSSAPPSPSSVPAHVKSSSSEKSGLSRSSNGSKEKLDKKDSLSSSKKAKERDSSKDLKKDKKKDSSSSLSASSSRDRKDSEREKLDKEKRELEQAKKELEEAKKREREREAELTRKEKELREKAKSQPAPPPPPANDDNCASCRQELDGKVVKVSSYRWHQACFRCHKCRAQLNSEVTLHEGQPFCDHCYKTHHSTRCADCFKPVEGRVVKALEKHYHPECFKCFKCRKQLTGAFAVSDGKPKHSSC